MLKEKIAKIEFIDLHAQRRALKHAIPGVLERVLEHGAFILGPEVQQLEQQLTEYTGAQETITCSDGTDALRLLLMAKNVGPGDAVFVPSFTFASSAEVIAQANATPVFIDVCPTTFNIDPQSLVQAIETLDKKLTPKGIIAVDLFGLPANYPVLHEIAQKHDLWVIADSAQSFGGAYQDKKVGNLAVMTSTSFFPSKPLACYGDGGAIFTNDKEVANTLRSLRNHGCGKHRYDHIHIGMNSRLDSMQAAILLEKLAIFPQERMRREAIACLYSQVLPSDVKTPSVSPDYTHAWGLYSVLCEAQTRDGLMQHLQECGVPSNIYYRKPLHLQPAYAHYPRASEKLAVTERISEQVLSLPMHPYLTDEQVAYVGECVKGYFK
ncbi:aminotransferase class I/II-fold pyridoxal phosphate-dependent enzyme [Candidatus Berkiella aquae]|uniref:DegT/DnrJ/EryC1/StrS family aminotransferase n=1 Tax=Candidatus Berkiella aquae TaxID=295108 RepID=A0A0Q9YJM8_9GAMM|nr:DegT/DnrJ/EryC1/StrS family aminotransferase [Candidatus Berkiella aquae]MCS5711352.1 DegT/DnrJ/EryC1/StrS family aminotransferase [Candidatus Berkiella aquae]